MKKTYFQKFFFPEIQVPYENPPFLLGKINQKYFLLNTFITLVILNTDFGLIWTTPWPDENEIFLNIAKIRTSRNSQSSVWKPNFFSRQAIPNTPFAVQYHCTGDTPYRVWFDLDNCLTRWKRIFFKILKNSQFTKIAKFHMKTQIFPRQAIPKVLFDLHSHYNGDTPFRVWFDLENSLTRWKRPIIKIPFSRNSKSSVWYTNFFPRQAVPIFFVLHSHYTGDTPYHVWFDLDNSLTRWKRPFFIILFSWNSISYLIKTQLFS